MTLDLATGRELWRTPPAAAPGEPAFGVLYDPERQFFIVGTTSLQLVDANTGQVIATRPSFHKGNNRRVTGGLPWTSGDDLYLYDFGLVRIGREQKKFLWGRKFVTFAKDDYTGANIGMAIAGALLGASTGNIPPDYLVGRSPEPVRANDRLIAAGVERDRWEPGLVARSDRAAGVEAGGARRPRVRDGRRQLPLLARAPGHVRAATTRSWCGRATASPHSMPATAGRCGRRGSSAVTRPSSWAAERCR